MISFMDEHLAPREFIRRVEEIKDLIRHRMGRIGLHKTVDGLRPDFWELKLRATDIITSANQLTEVPSLLEDVRSDQEVYQDEYSVHSLHALDIYRKAIAGILQNLATSEQPEDMRIPPDLDMPYHTVLEFREMPHWSFKYLSEWVKSSLDLDIAFFILMMHREEPIIPEQEEFILFLRQSAEHFGAYAAVLDLWKIPSEDESQPIRNTKIIAASLRSRTDLPSASYTADELKMLLVGDEV